MKPVSQGQRRGLRTHAGHPGPGVDVSPHAGDRWGWPRSLRFGALLGLAVWLTEPEAAAQPRPTTGAWPQFRGPSGSGVSLEGDFPTHFGPDSNVVWKITLPPGHSSPCIWNEHLVLTAYAEGKLETLCLDRRDGTIRWRQGLTPERIEPFSRAGGPAVSTPATDGQRVYVYFGSFGLLAYDFEGREQWRKPLAIPITQHGAGTSPVVVGTRVFLNLDQDVGSHLLAVDTRNGQTLWRTDRPGFRRGFSTPLLWPPSDPALVVVPGTLRLLAYDLRDGTERWSASGLPNEMVSSPVAGDGLVFVAGWTPGAGVSRLPTFDELLGQGDQNQDQKLTREEAPSGPARQHFHYIDADKDGLVDRAEWESIAAIYEKSQNALLAVRPDGRADVTETHVAWKQTRGLPYVPTPLVYEGRVYIVKNGGLVSCFDARTGAIHYQEERLGALGDYYASPVAAAGKIAIASQPGVVVVFKAGDTLEVLARNPLGEPVMATPAIVGPHLYVRTARHLYAFGQ